MIRIVTSILSLYVFLSEGCQAFISSSRSSTLTTFRHRHSCAQHVSYRQRQAFLPAMGRLSARSSSRVSPLNLSSETATTVPDDGSTKKGLLDRLKSIAPPANERKKLLPLALMFFCILFSYTILRDTKDVLMITAPKSGAEGTCCRLSSSLLTVNASR